MKHIDLTFNWNMLKVNTGQRHLESSGTKYTGMVYTFGVDSMDSSYIDLPGHILENDDGRRGSNVDVLDFFRKPARVLHMDFASGQGAVTVADLRRANNDSDTIDGAQMLVINALGRREPRDIELRSVWLDFSALDWIIATGCRVLVSDIYESQALHGVFPKLFGAGIAAVCEPQRLWAIPQDVELSVIFPAWPVTQIPCRIIAGF